MNKRSQERSWLKLVRKKELDCGKLNHITFKVIRKSKWVNEWPTDKYLFYHGFEFTDNAYLITRYHIKVILININAGRILLKKIFYHS